MKFRIIYNGNEYIVEIMNPGGRSWIQESFHKSYEEAVNYAFQRNNWQPLVCTELQSA
jgi:hypothetical protein